MRQSKAASLIIALVVMAALFFILWPIGAVAAPLRGFTSTSVPPPPSGGGGGGGGGGGPTETPAPVIYDPIITKLVSVDQAQVGDAVQYTLVITNPNGVEIPNVVIVDPLPDVLDYLSASSPQGTTSANGNTITFNLGTLAPGQVITIAIHTRVNSKGQPPNEFTNTAHLTWDDGRSVDSNTVKVTIVPALLPATGEGPGWREVITMAGMALAALSVLGLGGSLVFRRLRRGA